MTNLGCYEQVAAEYYSPNLHPTSANFNELSKKYVDAALVRSKESLTHRIVEVGAGRSLVAPYLENIDHPLSLLTLVDNSVTMLSHSQNWIDLGAKWILADARATGLPTKMFDILVASLGDPYNGDHFWREVSRLLKPGGKAIFTTPTHEWASCFRREGRQDCAEFLSDGRQVNVPSFIVKWADQLCWLQKYNLIVEHRQEFGVAELTGEPSVKLRIFPPNQNVPILVGFTATLQTVSVPDLP